MKDVDELRSRILTAWDELDQHVIDMAVRQWHKVKVGHFQQTEPVI